SRIRVKFRYALYIVRRTNKCYHSLDQACQGNNSEFEQKNLGFSQDGEQAIPPCRTEAHAHRTHGHRAHLKTRCLFEQAQRQRKRVEALFAELKGRIGLARLRLRRLKFVQEQFFLATTAQNIKRLVRFLSTPTTGPATVTA